MTTTYEELNSLEKFGIIAGSEFTLNYQMFEVDGVTPLDLTAGSAGYRLTYLGQSDNTIINKTGVIDNAPLGLWHVVLDPSDTEDLSGVFVGQPRVVDNTGSIFIPAQGEVVILPENQL